LLPGCALLALLAASSGLGHGLGLLLVWSDHHDHVSAILLGCRLDEPELLDIFGKPLQEPEPELWPGLLPAAEHDCDLDLVALLQEPLDVTFLGLVVVWIYLRPELHLLDDGLRLVLACLTGLDRGLVLEFSEVHELGNRRASHWCDLNQVEFGFLGEPQGIFDADDAHLLTVGTDEPDLGDADPVVDTGLDADGTS
jgi:hypothetical protein